MKRGSALSALFVGPKGEQHAVDRAAGRLPSRAVLKSDSPPRVGVDRRSIRVAGISCLYLHRDAGRAGYTGRRRAFGPGREPPGTRRLGSRCLSGHARSVLRSDGIYLTSATTPLCWANSRQRQRPRSPAAENTGSPSRLTNDQPSPLASNRRRRAPLMGSSWRGRRPRTRRLWIMGKEVTDAAWCVHIRRRLERLASWIRARGGSRL